MIHNDGYIYKITSYKMDPSFYFIEDPFNPEFCGISHIDDFTFTNIKLDSSITSQDDFKSKYPEYFL